MLNLCKNSIIAKNLFTRPCQTLRFQHETKVVDKLNEVPTPVVEENFHTPTLTKTKLSNLDKYLVYKFSNTKYASMNEVPDELSVTQVNYAKDKGRARAMIFLVGFTILGCLSTILVAKQHKKQGRSTYAEDLIKKHAQYSKSHQEMIKTTHKQD